MRAAGGLIGQPKLDQNDTIDAYSERERKLVALIAVGAMICAGGLLTNSAVNVVASMVRTN